MINPVDNTIPIGYNIPKLIRKWKRKKNHNGQDKVIPQQPFGRYVDIIV